jgi:hypothetical protein
MSLDDAGIWKTANGKSRKTKGCQVDDVSVAEVRALLADRRFRRDLLIAFLRLIQDRYGHHSADHVAALANEMRMAQAEVCEVAPPPGEARDDWWIEVEPGLDWNYTHPHEVFAEMKLNMRLLDNITWERLEETAVTDPSLSPEDPGQATARWPRTTCSFPSPM